MTMRTLILHHPELLLAIGFIIAGVSYFVGYYVGYGRGWKLCARHNAERNAEMQRERERLDGTITRTFDGNIGDPHALAAAYNAMQEIAERDQPSGDPPGYIEPAPGTRENRPPPFSGNAPPSRG